MSDEKTDEEYEFLKRSLVTHLRDLGGRIYAESWSDLCRKIKIREEFKNVSNSKIKRALSSLIYKTGEVEIYRSICNNAGVHQSQSFTLYTS